MPTSKIPWRFILRKILSRFQRGSVSAKPCLRKRKQSNFILTPKRRQSQKVGLSPVSRCDGRSARSPKARQHPTVIIWKLFKKQTMDSWVKQHLGVKSARGITQPRKTDKQSPKQARRNLQRCFLTEVLDSRGLSFYLISSRIGGKKNNRRLQRQWSVFHNQRKLSPITNCTHNSTKYQRPYEESRLDPGLCI